MWNRIDIFDIRSNFTDSITQSQASEGAPERLRVSRPGDAALAGGARIEFPPAPYYAAGIQGMRSTSGRVRPFDAAADGTVFGNGLGVVLSNVDSLASTRGNLHGITHAVTVPSMVIGL